MDNVTLKLRIRPTLENTNFKHNVPTLAKRYDSTIILNGVIMPLGSCKYVLSGSQAGVDSLVSSSCAQIRERRSSLEGRPRR